LDQGAAMGHDTRVYDVERECFHEADAIIAISTRVRDLIEKEYGVPAHKIHVVHNGLSFEEDDRFIPLRFKSSQGHMALYMGRLTVHKGPDVFLRAAEIVSRYDPSFSFVVAGAGELEYQLIHQAARSGIGSKVFFAGFARGAERKALIRYAGMLVMPSVAEPFGLVALEAAAEGTPVIMSKQSGVRDVLRHSLAADFWDVEELANEMLAIARYAPLKKHLSEYGSVEARLSTWDKAAEQCIALYTGSVAAR
jgi:glycosyltransferase involved in cell wall biosynthesis